MSENLKNEKMEMSGTKSKRNLTGCCEIYCCACPFYRSEISDLANRLKDALNAEKFDKIAFHLSGLVSIGNSKSG
jgi:hypothetical protein